ncbi:MAG: class I SAM-dependent methyltransferase [Gaiellaceae bacterium]
MSELAFSFGRIAAEYDDVRPEYAPEALDRAGKVLGLDSRSRVVDLAAGSGKLTRALAGRFDEVVAVEPSEEMRAVFARRSPGIDVIVGTAERIPLPDDSADAVFVGDAFHWFDGAAAVAELERVLRPRGGVALLWNHWWSDGDERMVTTLDPPLPAEAQKLFDDVYFASGRAAARAEMAAPLEAFAGDEFEPLVEEAFARTTRLSGAEVVDLYATVSAVAALPPAERAELKRAVLTLLEPSYRLEITTVLDWTRRA